MGDHVLTFGMNHDSVDAVVLEHPVDIVGLHIVLTGEVVQSRIVVSGGNHLHALYFSEGADPRGSVRVRDSQKSYGDRFQSAVSCQFLLPALWSWCWFPWPVLRPGFVVCAPRPERSPMGWALIRVIVPPAFPGE
jgi:hypothetical protein